MKSLIAVALVAVSAVASSVVETPEEQVISKLADIDVILASIEADLQDPDYLPGGRVPTQEVMNTVNQIRDALENAPTVGGVSKVPAAITTSSKPYRGNATTPFLIDVGDQPVGKKIQLIVWIAKAESEEVPGLEDYPEITLISENTYYDRAGVIQVYEWLTSEYIAPTQLTYKIDRQGSNQGLVGAAAAFVLDDVQKSWVWSEETKGYTSDFDLLQSHDIVIAAVYEGSMDYNGFGEKVVDIQLAQGSSEMGHLLIVRGDPFPIVGTCWKNNSQNDRLFLVIGGGN